MATIEDFFLERYGQLERERDGLRARVADLERQMRADAARDLALRHAREHLEYVEERERREAEREKTDEA